MFVAANRPARGTRVSVTLVDVAREAGVDQSTVSRVLRDDHRAKATDETRARIREVAARLGYVPNATARSLAMRRTSTIALLIPQVSGFIYADIIKGAGDEARRLGYVLVVADGSEMGRANDAIRTLVLEGRVDGLLLASGTLTDQVTDGLASVFGNIVVLNRQIASKIPRIGSLGGARPKASVRDGHLLLIAKFPHQNDDWDVMAWEKLTLDLAADAGIRVPATRFTRIDGRGVLLLERFDRRGAARVPYVSCMTLLDARDAEAHDYLEVAEAMPEVSAATRADLNELWRRIAFSLMVNNTDDHLRNHGLLHERGGWRLSPAFDINPNPDSATERITSIDGARSREDALDALCTHAAAFDLSDTAVALTLREVSAAVKRWREAARGLSIAPREIDQFAGTFWAPA